MSFVGIIKKRLIKKGYQVKSIVFVNGNSFSESEWFFQVSDAEKQAMLKDESEYFATTDFDNENYIGGNKLYVLECLENMPDLKGDQNV